MSPRAAAAALWALGSHVEVLRRRDWIGTGEGRYLGSAASLVVGARVGRLCVVSASTRSTHPMKRVTPATGVYIYRQLDIINNSRP